MTKDRPARLPGHRRSVLLGGDRDGVPAREVPLREIDGPPGATTVVLLHGWGATADLNFAAIYADLAARWRVLAPDQRGHGTFRKCDGRSFSLEASAEEVAGLIDVMAARPALVLGYSMGGPVALLLARRHPELVEGLVLVATAANFDHFPGERAALGAMGLLGTLATRLPSGLRTAFRVTPDLGCILQAGGALGRFHAEAWLRHLNVPATVVVTEDDNLVPAAEQGRLARLIPGAIGLVVAGGHDLCLRHPRRFATAAVRALLRVEEVAAESPHGEVA